MSNYPFLISIILGFIFISYYFVSLYCRRQKCILRQCPRLNKKFFTPPKIGKSDIERSEVIETFSNDENPITSMIEEILENSVRIGQMDKEKGSQTHLCKTCGKIFVKAKYAQKHCTKPHKIWSCPNCGKIISHRSNKARHIASCLKPTIKATTSKVQSFLCEKCHKSFKTSHTLKRHKIEVHKSELPVGKQACQVAGCGYRTDSVIQLKKHITCNHSNKEKIECRECPYKCYSEKTMKVHFKVVHDVESRTCDICKEVFTSKAVMKAHVFKQHKNNDQPIKPIFAVKRKIGQHAQHLVIYDQAPTEHLGSDQSRPCEESGDLASDSIVREGSCSQQGGPIRFVGE